VPRNDANTGFRESVAAAYGNLARHSPELGIVPLIPRSE
jgi:hypothetical protein